MPKIVVVFVLILSLASGIYAQSKTKSGRWLNGSWEGTGYQTDNDETWTMKLTVARKRYQIEYPSLKCGGRWKPISIESWKARFVEQITFGLSDCTNYGNVVIERLGNGQVAFRYSNRGTNKVTASAILNRTR